MTLTATDYKYVQIDDQNVAIITDTTMKVVELVTAHLAQGWSPEELHFQYPYLTMAQIHAALAYYWDHKEEIDADRQQRFQFAEQLKQQSGDSPFVTRLKAEGLYHS